MHPNNKLDILSLLSEPMKQVLRIQEERAGLTPAVDPADYAAMRQAYVEERTFWNEGGPVMHSTQDLAISTRHGTLRARLYKASAAKAPAFIFFIHGGGFLLGNVDTHDRMMRTLAAQADCALIGLDYSLSPEAKYPQALEEGADVLRYCLDNAATLDIDPSRYAFAGDSAGANMCMGLVLALRDGGIGTESLRALLLFYGLYGLQDSRTMRLAGGPWDGLTREDLHMYTAAYLEEPHEVEEPYYNIFNNDLSHGIPPCYICGAELDPLLDDSLTLHSVLTDKNIPCQLDVVKGALHAFLHYTKIMNDARDILHKAGEFFKKHTAA